MVTEVDSSEWTDTPEQKRKRAIKRAKECVCWRGGSCTVPLTRCAAAPPRNLPVSYICTTRLAEQKAQRRKKAMLREAALREGRVLEEEKRAPSKWELMDLEAQKFNDAYNKAHRPESLMEVHRKRVRGVGVPTLASALQGRARGG